MKIERDANEILEKQVYLGNLEAARSPDFRSELGITHILSICPDYSSTGPNHLTIPVDDFEYEDILVHLPQSCQFIQTALDEGGKVLVHCVMGVSRSATVVCAYLMLKQRLSAFDAIKFVKKCRPAISPNFGFVDQLEVFQQCNYQPSPTHEAYLLWKHERDAQVNNLLDTIDVVAVVPDLFFVILVLPFAGSLLGLLMEKLRVTHLLTLCRSSFIPIPSRILHLPVISKHIDLEADPDPDQEDPTTESCKFIQSGIESGGTVFLYGISSVESCAAACAYMMLSQNIDFSTALKKMRKVIHGSEKFKAKVRGHMQLYFDQVLSPRGLTW